jgi:copper chaperone CopZ
VTQCRKIPGVTDVTANLQTNVLTVRFDPSVTTRQKVLDAVDAVVGSVN